MSNDELIGVAQRMDESIVPYGTEIITQDEHGDTFYIIEEGEVSVTVSLCTCYVVNYPLFYWTA